MKAGSPAGSEGASAGIWAGLRAERYEIGGFGVASPGWAGPR